MPTSPRSRAVYDVTIPVPSRRSRVAAETRHATEQPISGELFVATQDKFLQPHGVGVGDHEGDVRCDGADIGNVIVEAFEFETDRAQESGARGSFCSSRSLDGMAKRRGVGKARFAGNALRQPHAMFDGNIFKNFFRALVRVEKPELQIKNRFAGDTEKKMARLDNTGVNRSEEHTSELQSLAYLVCRLLPEKKHNT